MYKIAIKSANPRLNHSYSVLSNNPIRLLIKMAPMIIYLPS